MRAKKVVMLLILTTSVSALVSFYLGAASSFFLCAPPEGQPKDIQNVKPHPPQPEETQLAVHSPQIEKLKAAAHERAAEASQAQLHLATTQTELAAVKQQLNTAEQATKKALAAAENALAEKASDKIGTSHSKIIQKKPKVEVIDEKIVLKQNEIKEAAEKSEAAVMAMEKDVDAQAAKAQLAIAPKPLEKWDDHAETEEKSYQFVPGARRAASSSVLVVGGTDGSGTRKVVEILAALGVSMVSEDPQTYDIHANLMGGWPPVVNRVLPVVHTLDYTVDSLPLGVQTSVSDSLTKLLSRAKQDSTKPESTRLAQGGMLKKVAGTSARGVLFGFKAPVAMTLVPLWHHLLPSMKMEFKFLHVLRDGRDIALSKNQGPVDKFYDKMYSKVETDPEKVKAAKKIGKELGTKDTRSIGSKAIRLWSDWNVQVSEYCTKHNADCEQVHSEATVSEDLTIRFETYRRLAQWVGSSLSNQAICCLSQQEAKFMGSHDNGAMKGGKDMKNQAAAVRKRYGKWREALKTKPEVLNQLNKEGAQGLKKFNYDVGWEKAVPAAGAFVCTIHPDCIKKAAPAAAKERPKFSCHLNRQTDYRGRGSKDIGMAKAKTADTCCIACSKKSNCMHFTFDSKSKQCYLKAKVGKVVFGAMQSNLISGDLIVEDAVLQD